MLPKPLAVLAVIGVSAAQASLGNWDYNTSGKDWTGQCKTGRRQSPINLDSQNFEGMTKGNRRLSEAAAGEDEDGFPD